MAQLDVKLTRSSPLFFGWRLRDALCDVCGSRLPGSWLRQLRRPPGLSALLRRYVIAHMPRCDMCAPRRRLRRFGCAEGLSLSVQPPPILLKTQRFRRSQNHQPD